VTSPATDARVLDWLTEAQRLLARLGETQAGAIAEASAWCADAIAGGGLVHLFGTGHSRIPVEEMFPRYGSYPGFNPIVELSMTFHTQVVGANGQRQSMFIERVRGSPTSSSIPRVRTEGRPHRLPAGGTTAVPVEMAWRTEARTAGDRGHLGRPIQIERSRPGGRWPAPRRGGPGHRPVRRTPTH
jgi:uncharacterized phosphosugar-binding protein